MRRGHVHGTDVQHCPVHIVTRKHAVVKVLRRIGLKEHIRVVLTQVLPRLHQEARCAHGRVYVPTDFDTK